FFFSSRRRHSSFSRDWSSDVCSSDLNKQIELLEWQKKATEAEYYPTVALSANYGFLGQGDKMPWWNGKENGVFWSDMASVGLNRSEERRAGKECGDRRSADVLK